MANTALVIIDMQVALVTGAHNEQGVLERIGTIANRCRREDVPVIYVQHNHGNFRPMMKGEAGWQIHPAIAPCDQDVTFEKTASAAFSGTSLAAHLRGRNR